MNFYVYKNSEKIAIFENILKAINYAKGVSAYEADESDFLIKNAEMETVAKIYDFQIKWESEKFAELYRAEAKKDKELFLQKYKNDFCEMIKI